MRIVTELTKRLVENDKQEKFMSPVFGIILKYLMMKLFVNFELAFFRIAYYNMWNEI